MNYQINNPLLKGFYPDPSIVRVEDDFYMVTSSFSYYPGVPIFHSKDLANWEQIGHVLDRSSQLPLGADFISAGIFAPTIRYHDGVFYMITTNVDHGGNFIVTAEKPEGPWSDPHWIEGAGGIDPSLFWDEDGKAYYTGTGSGGMQDNFIWISEIDLGEFKLVGEKKDLWNGSMKKAWSPEASHIYKKDGWYYLMIAEGGTEHYHAVTIARSRSLMGEYEGYQGNPIMTHRHLGMEFPIANTGHGDLVELKDGSWYMVMLASRPYGGYHKNMGRETFIAPVKWENEWPVVCPGVGHLEWSYPAPNLPEAPVTTEERTKDDFESDKLDYQWNYLGTPQPNIFKIEDSCLKIRAIARKLEPVEQDIMALMHSGIKPEPNCVGFVGRRQQDMSYTARTKLSFQPEKKQSAGIILLQNDYHCIAIEMGKENGATVIKASRGYKNLDISFDSRETENPYQKEYLGTLNWNGPDAILEITAEGQKHTLVAEEMDGTRHVLADAVDGSFLGSEVAGGFVGAYIGMFATGNGEDADNEAAFDWFTYDRG